MNDYRPGCTCDCLNDQMLAQSLVAVPAFWSVTPIVRGSGARFVSLMPLLEGPNHAWSGIVFDEFGDFGKLFVQTEPAEGEAANGR